MRLQLAGLSSRAPLHLGMLRPKSIRHQALRLAVVAWPVAQSAIWPKPRQGSQSGDHIGQRDARAGCRAMLGVGESALRVWVSERATKSGLFKA